MVEVMGSAEAVASDGRLLISTGCAIVFSLSTAVDTGLIWLSADTSVAIMDVPMEERAVRQAISSAISNCGCERPRLNGRYMHVRFQSLNLAPR